jgi:hypothetical protein
MSHLVVKQGENGVNSPPHSLLYFQPPVLHKSVEHMGRLETIWPDD